MEDKDLDKLFQERFEGIEAHPDPAVWDRISSSLDQKKSKKRLIPYWWLPAGVAAVMMMAFWIGGVFEQNPQEATLPVVVESDQKDSRPETPEQATPQMEELQSQKPEKDGLVQEEVQKVRKQGRLTEPGLKSQPSPGQSGWKNPVSTVIAQSNSAQKETKNSTLTLDEIAVPERNTGIEKEVDSGTKTASAIAENTPSDKINKVVDEPQQPEEVVKKDLFEVIEEQQAVAEIQTEDPQGRKWSLNAAVAPVYYNTLGEGSPIHSNFADNNKSGEVNMSYGVNLAYSLNKKLKIRSGVHRVDLGYTTNDIVFSSSLNASTNDMIENINYGANAVNLVVSSTASTADAVFDAEEVDIVAQSPAQNGQMRQQMRYLEIPLEMQYRFVDKKLSVDLIGGFSSLLLIDNQVSLAAEGRVTSMGEANNVNPLNFSTNLGIGLGYQLGTQWSLSVEPLFKYQLNTFDGDAGNFQPYSFGVYSGINFRF